MKFTRIRKSNKIHKVTSKGQKSIKKLLGEETLQSICLQTGQEAPGIQLPCSHALVGFSMMRSLGISHVLVSNANKCIGLLKYTTVEQPRLTAFSALHIVNRYLFLLRKNQQQHTWGEDESKKSPSLNLTTYVTEASL